MKDKTNTISCHCPVHHSDWTQVRSDKIQCPKCKADSELQKQTALNLKSKESPR
jgi:Zn finger protein HypA/HybF involved in hydrogenase expression